MTEDIEVPVPAVDAPGQKCRQPRYEDLPDWAKEIERQHVRTEYFHNRNCPLPLPICPYCHEGIRPETTTVIVKPGMSELGRYGAKLTCSHDAEKVFKNRGLIRVRKLIGGDVLGWVLHDNAGGHYAPFCGYACKGDFAMAAYEAGFEVTKDGADFDVGPRAGWKLSAPETVARFGGDLPVATIDVADQQAAVAVYGATKKAAAERAKLIVKLVGGPARRPA